MRENKNLKERLQELKEKYEPISDFDLIKVLELEDEYDLVSLTNPDHTRRRKEILDMRYRLLMNCKNKQHNEVKKDMYIYPYVNRLAIYYDGKIGFIKTSDSTSCKDAVDMLFKSVDISKFNININTLGIGVSIGEEFKSRNIIFNECEEIFITQLNKSRSCNSDSNVISNM